MAAIPPRSAAGRPARSIAIALVTLALDAWLLALGLGGAAALVREPRALALLAIWAAGALTLAARRPAHGQDVKTMQPDPLVMAGLLVLPYATPALGAWASRHGVAMLPEPGPLGWGGVALTAGGLALRIAAILQLGRRFSPVVAIQREHGLETRGLYAHIRHPGYLGGWLSSLGAGLAFGSFATLPLAAAVLALTVVRIRREERLLAEHFGADWSAYARRTGALIPTLG